MATSTAMERPSETSSASKAMTSSWTYSTFLAELRCWT